MQRLESVTTPTPDARGILLMRPASALLTSSHPSGHCGQVRSARRLSFVHGREDQETTFPISQKPLSPMGNFDLT